MALYQGIIGEGSSPVEPVEPMEPVLLWTNTSPTSEFAQQKVELNLTDYVGVIIEYGTITSTDIYSRLYVKKSDTLALGNNIYLGGGYTQISTENRAYSRSISAIDNTGITFTNCVNGLTTQNFNCVPMKIYGVKEYVVESVGNYELTTVDNISISQSYTVPSNINKFLMNVLIHASKGTGICSSVPLLIDTNTSISNQVVTAYVFNTEGVDTGIYSANVSYNSSTKELTLAAQSYSNYSTIDLCIHTVE